MSNFTLAAAMTLDNRRFLGGMRQSRSATGAAVGGLKSLIAPLATLTAGYLSLRGAVSLATQSLGQAAGAERTRATFEILLGSAKEAKSLFNDLTKFSDVTPFEPGPVQQAAKALLAAKFEARDLKGLLTDAGDLASVMDKDIGTVADAFARLNSGDAGQAFERFRDFGISKQELEAEGLQFDKGGSYQGSVEQAMNAVRNIIQSRFGGTMERVSETNIGLMCTLTGAGKEVQRVFGEPINDELKPVLKDAIEWMKGMKDEAAEWGKTVADAVKLIYQALKQDRGIDLLKAGLELAAANFGNLLLNGFNNAAQAFGAVMGSTFENGIFPSLLKGFEGLAYAFAGTLAGTIPQPFLGAQKAVARPAFANYARQEALDAGFIKGGVGGSELTERGQAKFDQLGVKMPTGFFKNVQSPAQLLVEAMTEANLEREFDMNTAAAKYTKQSGQLFTEATQELAKSLPKVVTDVSEYMKANRSDEDFYGAGAARQNLDRLKGDIGRMTGPQKPPVFDMESFFGKPANLLDAKNPAQAFMDNVAAFREKLLGGSAGAPTTNPLTETAQSIRAITADRLQRIGGFVGGTGPERRSADRTAKATEESAKRLKAIESKLTNPTGMPPPAAAWA